MPETTKADGGAQVTIMKDCPRLLFVADLPPCHLTGGPILMHRLLSGYPMERLTVACSSGLMPRATGTLLPCRHVSLFQTTGTGRWGLGRIKQLVDVAAFGPMVWSLERLLRETQSEAVLTVAHGMMFIAVVLAAKRAGKPSVVVVHDDWLWVIGHHTWVPKALAPSIFGRTLRRATHVYAISDGVQKWLREEFHVDSEVQLPCADSGVFPRIAPRGDGTFRLVYAGSFDASTAVGMRLLIEGLRGGAIGENWTLDLYGLSPGHATSQGWEDARVTAHGWRPQQEVHTAMAGADLLYAAFGFDALARRLANRQFPSKMADYLAARRPVLVCAPRDTAISRYIHRWNCAELVEEPSREAVAAALHRLATSPERRDELVERGWEAFRANHEVAQLRAQLVSRLRQLSGWDRRMTCVAS
jgi:glycosyltransferase involved in cell wall biosynthesis